MSQIASFYLLKDGRRQELSMFEMDMNEVFALLEQRGEAQT